MKFIPIMLHVQEGDVISSKLGILQQSALTEQHYLVRKFKVRGKDFLEIIGEKEPIDVKPVKKGGVLEK